MGVGIFRLRKLRKAQTFLRDWDHLSSIDLAFNLETNVSLRIMLPTFSNLSHDLILQIADLLLEEEDESAKNPWAPVTDRMSFGEQAVFNLSRTSTSLYKLLSPYLFRFITLRNTEKSGQAVQYLCSTSQVANVKTLLFKCEGPPEKEEDLHDIESILPNGVNGVLSNLSQFPRLATLIIDLGMDYFWDFRDDVESEEEVEKAEEQKRWRAVIKKTLKAISTTCSNGVREFVLKQCPTRSNSVFCSEQFNKVRHLTQDLHNRRFSRAFQASINPCVLFYLLFWHRLDFSCLQHGFCCLADTM